MSEKVKKQTDVNSLAAKFLRERAPAYAPPISRRLVGAIRKEMVKGIKAGERVGDMAGRVRKILRDQGPFRAMRIVRTEVVGAFNRGTLENYREAGPAVVQKKEWLTSRDAQVRPYQAGHFDHQSADTQRRNVQDPFTVSGELLMHPGDPAGSPGNIIECRCAMSPVTVRQLQAPPEPAPPAPVVVPARPRRRPRPARPRPGPRLPPGGPVAAPAPPRAAPAVPAAVAPEAVAAARLDLKPKVVPRGAKPGVDFISPEGKIVKPREFFRGQPGVIVRPSENGLISFTPTRHAAEFHRDLALRDGKPGRLITADIKLNNPLRVTPERFDDLSFAPKATIDAIKAAGHDGIIASAGGSISVTVFDVSQLKNAAAQLVASPAARAPFPSRRPLGPRRPIKPRRVRVPLRPPAQAAPVGVITPKPPELPQAPTARLRAQERSLVQQNTVSSEPLGGGANLSEVHTLADGSKGVWKPAIGEEELGRTAIQVGTYYKREAATWEVAKIIGLDDLVPPTVVKKVENQVGSMQAFIAKPAKTASELGGKTFRRPGGSNIIYDGRKDLARAATFDYAIANSDRHAGNWMLAGPENKKIKLIDNGLSFPMDNFDMTNFHNTRLFDRALTEGMAFDKKVLDALDKKFDKIAKALKAQGIEPIAIDAMRQRIQWMKETGTFTKLGQKLNKLYDEDLF